MDLPRLFRNYLKSQKISPITSKNYVADINNFLVWLAQKTGIKYQIAGKALFSLFTKETVEEYKTDLVNNHTPFSTINRRLSALRKFGQFALNQGWLIKNETFQVKNLYSPRQPEKSPKLKILEEFKRHLEGEKVSPITIKNYLSDLRNFLAWIEIIT